VDDSDVTRRVLQIGLKIVIGRSPEADVRVSTPYASSRHCRLTVRTDGFDVEDLDSTNGTFVNGTTRECAVGRIGFARFDDTLYLGSYRFPLPKLPGVLKKKTTSFDRSDRPERALELTKGMMTVGRDPGSDFFLDHPQVSWNHARIEVKGDHYVISDQASANGTFVNGKRIKSAVLSAGDTIAFGPYRFGFQAKEGIIRPSGGDIAIQARNIGVRVPQRYLLEGISFSIFRGELVGIMGPSGAGKTTMLYALLGIAQIVGVGEEPARCLLNGLDVAASYDELRSIIGYVPQDEIIHPELTVRQAMTYAALLRFPDDTTSQAIDARVNQLLDDLGLRDAADVLVGGPEKKGVSGGQRKRVNIALELLTSPSLLFLDEPTSGLASEDAVVVVNLLRELTEKGNTVVLTVHQPGYRIYSSLDKVLILCAKTKVDMDYGPAAPVPGRLIYYGPAVTNFGEPVQVKDDSIVFFNPQVRDYPVEERPELLKDPEAPLFGMDRKECVHWFSKFKNHEFYRTFVTEPEQRQPDPAGGGGSVRRRTKSNPLRQWWILTSRYALTKMKDKGATVGLLAQAPVIGLILAAVFGDDDPFDLPIFLLIVVAIWFGCINAVTEIAKEKAIYARERMVFLQIVPYVMSKLTVLALLSLVQSVVLLFIMKVALDLEADFSKLLGIMFLCSLGGLALGLLLSAVRPTLASAMSILPIILTFQIVLGGAMQFLPDMDVMPKDIRIPQWVAQITISRWGYEALLTLEEDARKDEWEKKDCKPVACEFKPPEFEMPSLTAPGEYPGPQSPKGEETKKKKRGKKKKKKRKGRDDDSICPRYPQTPVCCRFQEFQLVDDDDSRSRRDDDRDDDDSRSKRDDDRDDDEDDGEEKGKGRKKKKKKAKNLKDGKCTAESTFESFDDQPRSDVGGCALVLLLITVVSFAGVCLALKMKDK